jgi:hypothetical protein
VTASLTWRATPRLTRYGRGGARDGGGRDTLRRTGRDAMVRGNERADDELAVSGPLRVTKRAPPSAKNRDPSLWHSPGRSARAVPGG